MLRSNAMKKDIERSTAFNRCFLPGQRIDMSMMMILSGFSENCPGCTFYGNDFSSLTSGITW